MGAVGNILLYRDNESLTNLVQQVNNLPGTVLESPRQDMVGTYVISDIMATQAVELEGGWGILILAKALSEDHERADATEVEYQFSIQDSGGAAPEITKEMAEAIIGSADLFKG